jgi:hypothetical protein
MNIGKLSYICWLPFILLPINAQVLTLDTFNTMRTNGQGTRLWDPQVNYNQTISVEQHDGDMRLRTNVNGETVDFGQPIGYYVAFFPINGSPRYPWPQGFTKSYITSGTWNPMINRMEFWMKCNKFIPTDITQSLNIGTYVKGPTAPADDQGVHYYHYFHPNIYANRWMKVEMNWTPTHRLGSPGSLNYSPDPQASDVHYFDGLTRWYISIPTSGTVPFTCWVDDVKMFAQTGEPDDKVKSITAMYTGSKYEVTWDAVKNNATPYEVRYSTSSMKASGFQSGTSGGLAYPPGNDYGGVVWSSPAMPESAGGMYFAIKPGNSTTFTEIFLPRYGSGVTGSPCDVNGDAVVSSADASLANQAALGLRSCTNDLDGNGRCDVVDSQRVINAALGGACKTGL